MHVGRRPSLDASLLLGILIAAALARYWRLDLMEFKADEANASRLALHVLGYAEPGRGRFFPTAGLVSSVGVPNPPLFVYLMALPFAIVRSPIAAVVFVATANVVAVWLTYVVGKRCFSRFVGVGAAALLAVSPWGIIFSRKIWAQDLLPIFTTLFALQLYALVVEKRRRAGFWLVVIAAGATQIHFSAWILVGVAALALFLERRTVAWRWVGAGVGVAALAYTPFLVYHAGQIIHVASRRHHHQPGPGIVERFDHSVGFMLSIVGGGGTSFLIGHTSPLATALSVVLGVLALGGVAGAARRGGVRGRLGQLLAVWYLLPLTALTLLPVRTYIHYFIVILPLPFLGVAAAVERVLRTHASMRTLVVVACVCCFVALDVQLFRTVARDGGAPGDYGVAYRYTRQAVSLLERRNRGESFAIGADTDFAAVPSLLAYRFLIWNAHPGEPTPAKSSGHRYVLVDTFKGTPPGLRADPRAASYPRTPVGPLVIVSIPGRGG